MGCDPLGQAAEDPLAAGAIGASVDAGAGASANAILGLAQAVDDATFIATDTELIEGTQAINSASRTYTVYQSFAADGSTVNYVGMTCRFVARAAEQLFKRQIKIKPILEGLSKADARAVEQTLIDYFKLGKNGGSLINKINSISSSADYKQYVDAIFRGVDLLKQAGYNGF